MPIAYKSQSLLILPRKPEIKRNWGGRNAADNLLTENVVFKAAATMQ